MWQEIRHVSKSVENLVQNGYKIRAFYRRGVSSEEAVDRNLGQEYVDNAKQGNLKAALLLGPDGELVLRYFYDFETLDYIDAYISYANANPTAGVYIIFSISFLQLGTTTHYNLDNVLASMKAHFGWNVKPSPLGSQLFEMLIVTDRAGEETQNAILKDVEVKLLLLSLLYRAGIYIHYWHVNIAPKSEFVMGVGPEEQAGTGFRPQHIDQLIRILESEPALKAAQALQAFYRQTTKVGRLALGWMVLEDLFGKVGATAQFLKKHERKALEKLIQERLQIDADRKAQLIDCFRASNRFRRSRNDLMAERISELTGASRDAVREKIADLSKARAKVVHSFTAEDDVDVSEHEKFIEFAILHYILRQSSTKVVHLRSY